MLSRAHLLVRAFTSTVKTRPELTGIYVASDRTAATDSYVLAEVRTIPDKADKPEDFPIMPNLKAQAIAAPFIMPSKVADDLAKSIPKSKALPILENAAYCGTNDQGAVTFAATDLETVKPVTFKPIDGRYPEYATIMELSNKDVHIVRLNAEYLLKAAKFLQDFNKLEMGRLGLNDIDMGRLGLNDIDIEVRGPHDPVVFKAHGKRHEGTVLVMPIKV